MPDPGSSSDRADGIVVAYPAGRDVGDWERRHGRGLVPGRWPYGLSELEAGESPVSTMALPAPTRLSRLMARGREMFRSSRGAVVTGARSSPVLLTWDESTAVRAVGRRSGFDHCSGVIWLTDRPDGRTAQSTLRALQGCAALWTLSSAQVEPLEMLMGHGGPPVRAIRFGVDHQFFDVAPYPDRPLVVSVGGDRDRDPQTLFAALAQVNEARPDAEIVVQSQSELPVPDGVTVVPHLTHVELRDLYRRMSVMVIATRHNLHVSGMTVSLEARSTGRPVVITRTPGMEDYVSSDDAVTVDPGDSSALAAGVVSLLDDADLAAGMGLRGRANVESRHTQATMCRELRELVRP